MKFKLLFFIFNGIFVAMFSLIFLLPFFLFGQDPFQFQAGSHIYVPAFIFLIFVVFFDVYFFQYHKIYSTIEKGDYNTFFHFFEDSIFIDRKIKSPFIFFYLKLCIETSNYTKIRDLENELLEVAPKYISKYPQEFSFPYLVEDLEIERSTDFFLRNMNNPKTKFRGWMAWGWIFSLFSQKKEDDIEEQIPLLLELSENSIPLKGMMLYTILKMEKTLSENILNLILFEKDRFVESVGSHKRWDAILQHAQKRELYLSFFEDIAINCWQSLNTITPSSYDYKIK